MSAKKETFQQSFVTGNDNWVNNHEQEIRRISKEGHLRSSTAAVDRKDYADSFMDMAKKV